MIHLLSCKLISDKQQLVPSWLLPWFPDSHSFVQRTPWTVYKVPAQGSIQYLPQNGEDIETKTYSHPEAKGSSARGEREGETGSSTILKGKWGRVVLASTSSPPDWSALQDPTWGQAASQMLGALSSLYWSVLLPSAQAWPTLEQGPEKKLRPRKGI